MVTTFKDYEYKRPDLTKLDTEVDALLIEFNLAGSPGAQAEIIDRLNTRFNTVSTMENLAYIRSSIDTNDEFYDRERNFFDEYGPTIQEITNKYYKAITESNYREELEEKYGSQLFELASNSLTAFDPNVKELLRKENTRHSE